MKRIEENFSSIYVRELFHGKWQSVSLDELPAEVAMKHVFRWLKEVMPQNDDETTTLP